MPFAWADPSRTIGDDDQLWSVEASNSFLVTPPREKGEHQSEFNADGMPFLIPFVLYTLPSLKAHWPSDSGLTPVVMLLPFAIYLDLYQSIPPPALV